MKTSSKRKKVGEVTRDDINQIFYNKEVMKHASRSIHGIINAIVQPMKYAYSHGLTDINCYDGLIKPAVQYAKREILTMEEIRALFNAEWEKTFFTNAKKHVSESFHKFVQKLKRKKKEVEEKDKALDKALEDVSKLSERAQSLSQSSATRYEDFEDNIQFKNARKMAFSRDGNDLCQWFTNVDRKFSAWLHKSRLFH